MTKARTRTLEVSPEDEGERVDVVLARAFDDLSRSRLQKLLSAGAVRIDGVTADKSSQAVTAGQRLEVDVPPDPAVRRPQPQDIPVPVLHEDDHLAVVDKPAGLVVHPGSGNPHGTLANALLARYGRAGLSSVGGEHRPGIVHRLDKGTSGVLVVARTDEAHEALARQFADRTVDKLYEALVYGRPDGREGLIDVPLGRDRVDRTRTSPRTDSPRRAVTRWSLLEDFRGFALLAVEPRTGRTHQIRAHLAHIQHPCVGDRRYAGKHWKGVQERRLRTAARSFGRPALHARRLAFAHPADGRRVEFEAPRPADLEELLALLREVTGG